MKSRNKIFRSAAKIIIVFSLLLVLVFAFSNTAFAGVSIEGDPDITIGSDEVIKDDLFLSGQDILVEGTIHGDLFASGETVTITGTVDGNLFISGVSVKIGGTVDGAAVVAGYTTEIQPGAVITRNLYYAGFDLQIQEGALVERSLYIGSYQTQISGQVDRHVVAGSAAFVVNGYIDGDVVLQVGDPDSRVPRVQLGEPFDRYEVEILRPGKSIAEGAIGGDFEYQYSYMETALDFNLNFNRTVSDAFSFFFAQRFRRLGGEFIAILLVGALLLYVAKDWILKTVEEIKANALRDAGTGLLVFLLYLPAVILLFLVFGALVVFGTLLTLGSFTGELIALTSVSFAGILTAFSLLVSIGAKVVFSYLVGRWILERSQVNFESYWNHFYALALGAFLYEVIRIVPIFSSLIAIIVAILGTGAFFFVLRQKLNRKPAEITPA